MSRIHFIGGEKGGVGKSVVARVLAQWFVDRSIPFAAVDGEIERALDLFRNQLQHIVVKNFGRSKDFSQFDESDAKSRLDELSGLTLELPELDSATMYRIDRFGLSFWAAIHRTEGEAALKPLERQRVKLWLERCYAQLDARSGAL